jgi:hypothetical protein
MLETAILELTEQLKIFNANIATLTAATVPTAKPEQAPTQVDDVPGFKTHKDLQDLCLSVVRGDMAKKPKIKEILGKFSASKVNDLSEADTQKAFAEISAL